MENVLLERKNWKSKTYKILIYFVFYSFIGYLLETIFGIFSKGVWESRQSFLFGPFCAIYGIGAVLMILFLNKLKGRYVLLFFLGSLIGTISEYLMSYLCDVFLHFKWWDYTNYFLNINGRTCLYFAIMWGVLAIVLIQYVNPFFNHVLDKISESNHSKIIKVLFNILMVFLVFDIIATTVALRIFYLKIDKDFHLSVNNSGYATSKLSYQVEQIDNSGFSFEEYMLKIFPNIRVTDSKNTTYFVDSLYKNIQTYYIKLFDKEK